MNRVHLFDQVIKQILKNQISAGIGKLFIDNIVVKSASPSKFLDKNSIPEEVALGI